MKKIYNVFNIYLFSYQLVYVYVCMCMCVLVLKLRIMKILGQKDTVINEFFKQTVLYIHVELNIHIRLQLHSRHPHTNWFNYSNFTLHTVLYLNIDFHPLVYLYLGVCLDYFVEDQGYSSLDFSWIKRSLVRNREKILLLSESRKANRNPLISGRKKQNKNKQTKKQSGKIVVKLLD